MADPCSIIINNIIEKPSSFGNTLHIILGGALAIIGGILGSFMNAYLSKRNAIMEKCHEVSNILFRIYRDHNNLSEEELQRNFQNIYYKEINNIRSYLPSDIVKLFGELNLYMCRLVTTGTPH